MAYLPCGFGGLGEIGQRGEFHAGSTLTAYPGGKTCSQFSDQGVAITLGLTLGLREPFSGAVQ